MVHRDLRWQNVACDPTKHHFYLLDLELVGPSGSQPEFHLTSWGQDTLEDGNYTEQSDLHMLGKMMLELNHVIQSAVGRQYLELATQPVDAAPKLSAMTLLNNPWIACQGISCRVAGAQPNQHRNAQAQSTPSCGHQGASLFWLQSRTERFVSKWMFIK